MSETPEFDVAAAHKYFAASCFNRAWELIEKDNRTAHEARLMVALSHASIYHWSERPDCSNERLSVGYWQASRIQAVLGNAAEATAQAQQALSFSHGLAPFYLGFACEALARAATIAGDRDEAARYVALAKEQAVQLTNTDDRASLIKELDSI